MASWWKQRELECFASSWVIPSDVALTLQKCNKISLRSGRWHLHHKIHWCSHFLLMSAGFVISVLRILCLSTPFAPGFVFSWPLSSCYSLERVCPSGLQSPSSPFAHSYVSHWRSVCLSTLVRFCHMESPLPLDNLDSHYTRYNIPAYILPGNLSKYDVIYCLYLLKTIIQRLQTPGSKFLCRELAFTQVKKFIFFMKHQGPPSRSQGPDTV